ncbi:ubiquitin carboxyl-terminal hydrolase MINDY-2 isoform X2 [Megalops cyprinoides]|uniref:ubiquitin carboxyl-terminal hydrolase MINDY-2 isoform X2 n=1 Tax=Megalops cyprinoides TaxID=118141 RepID=UPI00186525CB|nr:ubiquitin carboxyl-terminal hydrolase MINDY-2 isoform X2 [Megalops cyprinoides]
MEQNASLHRDLAESALCSTICAETSGIKVTEVVKGAVDSSKNSEPSALSTLVSSSDSSILSASTANALSDNQKSDVRLEINESLPVENTNIQPSGWLETSSSELGDQLSNGMGHSLPLAPGSGEGATSKLVNNRTDGDPPSTMEEPTARITDTQTVVAKSASQEQTKISPPTSLCPDKTSLTNVKPGALASSDHVSSEGPPTESDPSPAGESRSFDSLESFSNLNSCPSSDLNSEGMEDRVLAIALQSNEYGADEAKISCIKDRGAGQSIYHIKWIKWKEENTPIITQNENGPCPLLAIMNVLLLAWKVKMPPMMEIITAEQLMEYLGDYILDAKPKEISEAQRLNYEQNMSDAMAVLHKLQTGLDVNVKFTGVRVFEYTPECIVFDLLDIPLYHGWLVDPQMADIVKAVGNCSYNQLVEKIISCKQSESSELAGEGYVAEQFLNSTATQLTYHGLCELTSTVQEGELCVFFRNNHFSTMTKFKGQLYLLVTDQGFLTEEKVVWESLHNVDGDGNFCDSEFRLRPPSDPETVYRGQQDQIDQDYLMALSLQQEQQALELNWEQIPEGISDLELAKKLQEEEDRRASQFYQEQEQAAAAQAQQGQQQPAGGDADAGAAAAAAAGAASATPSPGKQPSTGERKPKKEPKDKDKCVLL